MTWRERHTDSHSPMLDRLNVPPRNCFSLMFPVAASACDKDARMRMTIVINSEAEFGYMILKKILQYMYA